MAISPFQTIPIEECGEALIKLSPDRFLLEPAYFEQGFSDTPDLYVREGVYQKLEKIEAKLAGRYRLLIWDPWRSREIQQRIFEHFDKKIRSENIGKSEAELQHLVGTFVSPANDMNRIPPHSTGGAIDLTLVDSNGNQIDMGTVFDDTTSRARTDYFATNEINQIIQGNRERLLDIMATEGFVNYPDEWWHFDYGTQLGVLNSGGLGVAVYGEVSADFILLQSPYRAFARPGI